MVALQAAIIPVAQQVGHIAPVTNGAIGVLVPADDPADMTPPETGERRMRVHLLVTVPVVQAVNGHPARGAVLQIEHAHGRQRVLEPFRAGKSAVGQQPVVADRDPEHTENKMPKNGHNQPRPGKKPRNDGKKTDQVYRGQHDQVRPQNS